MTRHVLLLDSLFAPTQQALESTYTCHRVYEAPDRAAALRELSDIAQVAATQSGIRMDQATLDLMPNLKLLANFGVGIDTIDLPACTAHGVKVTNTPDVLTEEVADMALALLLASIRQIPQGDQFVRQGQWLKGGMPLTASLQGRRVGIIGLGRIGQAIARRCAAFNTDIAWHGPRKKPEISYPYFDDPVALADWASVIIAACPGGAQTAGIVSREVMSALGPDGVLVNIARGSVVDQPALVELIGNGQLGGAGLDVFADEPNVPAELIDTPHIVLQPHMGSASVQTRTAMGQLVLDNIAAWFDDKPLVTPVN